MNIHPNPVVQKRRWLILPVLCISLFMVVVDNLIINVALPTLSRELGASTSGLQWIVDSYSLVFACLLLAFGALGDRLGRKGVMQFGMVAFVACSVWASFAQSTSSLIIARGAMGVGAAAIFPATLAIVIDIFRDPIERAKAIGVWSAVSGVAVAFGPITGGVLLEHFYWGSVFFVNLPVGVIALTLGALLIPSSKDPNPRAIDMKGFILSIAMVGLLVFTVIEAPHQGWMSGRTLVSFVATAALFAIFIWCELKAHEPLLDVRVFRNARISAATGSIGAAFFVLFGFTFLVTQYFQFVRGYSTLSSGLHTLPFAFGAGITSPIAARLALKFGTKRVVAHGLLNMSIGLVVIGFSGADVPYWGPVVIGMLFLATGLGLVTSPSTDAVMGSLPAERAGVGSAINDVSREVGGTLGVAISGSVFASLYGPKLGELIANFGMPADAVAIAKESAGAGFAVAEMAPTPEATEAVRQAVSEAFMHGFHAAVFVGAGVAFVGSLCAWKFLPARNRSS
ncbi:MAG: DHA2 family efflux MFS transporter permease subunit [Actinobacteria bacterium]|nr:DHA2 family efflux MFS transporter permease subunit [Actinomycetota bacterium]